MEARSFFAASLLIVALGSSPAFAFDRGIASAYATAFATAYEAQRNCPGLAMDEDGLTALRLASGLTDADDGWLKAQFAKLRPDLEGAIVHAGAKQWCAAAVNLFGPRGLRALRVSPD